MRSTGSWRSSRHHPRCWKEIERETVIHASEAVAARSAVKACTVYIIMSRRSTAGISRQSIFHYNIYNLSSSVQCVCTSTISLPPCSVCVCMRTHTKTHCTCACRGVRCHQSMCKIRPPVAAPETSGSSQTLFSCRLCYPPQSSDTNPGDEIKSCFRGNKVPNDLFSIMNIPIFTSHS